MGSSGQPGVYYISVIFSRRCLINTRQLNNKPGYGTEAARLIIRYGGEQLNLHRINYGAINFNGHFDEMFSR